ncbi:MAG: 2OG-Fe(II) oxygenase, partial [Bacteroidia bacterium]
HQLKTLVLECLQELKGSGKFAAVYSHDFVLPGLTVNGMGEIALPLQTVQAKALIQMASKAPFGKGSKTFVDDKVRSGWEIDANQLHFKNPQWTKFLDRSIKKLKKTLGIEEYTVEAHLYKLLVYEKGDFFLQHKDSEKEEGMFGSLIIGLPSEYSGGELLIRFEGEEVIADFTDDADKFGLNCAAFYADCDHEVKPLKSGYRICLVYNLVQKKSSAKIELHSVNHHANQLAHIFTKNPIVKPYIVLLGHQYTPANFSYNKLKLNDRYKADALLKAAANLGYYAKLCLVTSYKMGVPVQEFGYGYDNDGYDDDAIMDEVIDESLEIEFWGTGEIPALNAVRFNEEDLIASFAIDEDEPIVKESSGYMGNYGPDLSHWYHYGAVTIWSPAQNAKLLEEQSAATQLEWIGYYNHVDKVSEEEKRAVETILKTGLNSNRNSHYDYVTDWLIRQNDQMFLTNISNERLQLLFENISADSWQKIWEWLPKEESISLFEKLLEDPKPAVFEKLTTIIRVMASNEDTIELAERQCATLPEAAEKLSEQAPFQPKANTLADLFWLENQFSPGKNWINTINGTIVNSPNRKYIHKVLIPKLLDD